MGISLTPKYTSEIPLENFTKEQFLVLAIESALKNKWTLSLVSPGGFIAYSRMSWSSWSEEINLIFKDNTAIIKSACTGSQIADWGKNKKNIENFISDLNQIKATFNPEAFHPKYEELQKKFVKDEDHILDLSVSNKESINSFFAIFKPSKNYFITPLLIIINILLFIIMCSTGVNVFLPDNDSLLAWGANFKPATLDGQWWRLFTACFLHIGIIHLLMNMYALLYIGILLEPLLGKTKFSIAFISTGIVASAASLWWNDYTISAGASGAIFGLYGVFLALLTTNIIEKAARYSMLSSILIFVGYNLIFGLKGGVDNAAHIGGLLSGIFFGYCYYFVLRETSSATVRKFLISTSVFIALCFCFFIYTGSRNDMGIYQKGMEQFSEKENTALEIYNLPDSTNKKVLLKKVKLGIRMWLDNAEIIKKLSRLNLPDYYRERINLLEAYCYARMNAFQYTYKAIDENTEKYQSHIESYNNRIASIIEKIESLNNK